MISNVLGMATVVEKANEQKPSNAAETKAVRIEGEKSYTFRRHCGVKSRNCTSRSSSWGQSNFID